MPYEKAVLTWYNSMYLWGQEGVLLWGSRGECPSYSYDQYMSNMGGHFLVFLIRTLKITFFVSVSNSIVCAINLAPMSKSSPPQQLVLTPQPLKLVQETRWRKKAHDEKPLHLGVVSGYVCLYVTSLCCSGFFSRSTPERRLLRHTNHGSISEIRHFWMYVIL